MDDLKETERLYGDLFCLPHPEPAGRVRMSAMMRAAQFSPFAALTGYEEAVEEAGRRTDERRELSEDQRRMLDEKLQAVIRKAGTDAVFTFTCFVPDDKKAGGSYERFSGSVRRVDSTGGRIFLSDGEILPLSSVAEIEGPGTDGTEE